MREPEVQDAEATTRDPQGWYLKNYVFASNEWAGEN